MEGDKASLKTKKGDKCMSEPILAVPIKRQRKMKLGEILLCKGYVTENQLMSALEEARAKKKKVGEVLVEMGYATEDAIAEALAEQYNIDRYHINEIDLTKSLYKIIPENIAKKYRVIPVKETDSTITVITDNPVNIFAIDELKRITRKDVKPAIVTQSELDTVYELVYGNNSEKFKDVIKKVQEKITNSNSGDKTLRNLAEEVSVIDLVDGIVNDAIVSRASDIHIDPEEDVVRVRFRIDGILYDAAVLAKILHPVIVSRIKIMSGLDIAERRLPQDGKFRIKKGMKNINFRVSTLPTSHGEKTVLRILDRDKALLNMENLGMDEYNLSIYRKMLSNPHGIILISGPTGSGKTTTLYASINHLNTPGRNIITVEDPIEYDFRRINQVSVDETSGLTFANALRSILRQDPDIIMIGEIRDRETAEIAVQASLTGHLVLSTIHTNDAATTVTRLVEMGIDRYLVASSLIGVVAQRLVRKVCPHCKTEVKIPEDLANSLNLKGSTMFKGKGCDKCRNTGYKGRIGVYEIISVDKDIRELIAENAPVDRIRDVAIEKGMRTMREYGAELVRQGITTVEEVLRVTS